MKLILASASPRRAELLKNAGLAFEVMPAELDESPLPNESPGALVIRLSLFKAQAVFALHPDARVLAADTVVALDGETLGKPADAQDAKVMLRRLSGRAHEVMTGFCLLQPGQPPIIQKVCTQVFFRALREHEIESYVASAVPMDKAGAYGIQSDALCMVTKIEGSYSNVVGLPMAEVLAVLQSGE